MPLCVAHFTKEHLYLFVSHAPLCCTPHEATLVFFLELHAIQQARLTNLHQLASFTWRACLEAKALVHTHPIVLLGWKPRLLGPEAKAPSTCRGRLFICSARKLRQPLSRAIFHTLTSCFIFQEAALSLASFAPATALARAMQHLLAARGDASCCIARTEIQIFGNQDVNIFGFTIIRITFGFNDHQHLLAARGDASCCIARTEIQIIVRGQQQLKSSSLDNSPKIISPSESHPFMRIKGHHGLQF